MTFITLPFWDILLLQEVGVELDSDRHPVAQPPPFKVETLFGYSQQEVAGANSRVGDRRDRGVSKHVHPHTGRVITFVSAYLPLVRSSLGRAADEVESLSTCLSQLRARNYRPPNHHLLVGMGANLDNLGRAASQ